MKTIKQRFDEVRALEPSMTVADFFFEKIDNYSDNLPEFLNSFSKIKATPLPATLMANHKDKLLLRDYESDLDMMQNDIMLALWENRYRVEGLWDSINFEYNPLDNTDYTLETTTEYGEHTSSQTVGSRHDSDTVGARHDSAEIGSRVDKVTDNPRTDNVTNKVTGYNDSDILKTSDKTETSYGKRETDTNIGKQTNTSDLGAQTNTSDIGEQTNNSTDDAHTDTYTERKHGNIGVTSSATLIREHRDIVNYNLWRDIAQIIIDAICLSIYPEEGWW